MVDRAALEMRSTGNRTGGSNPSLSATILLYVIELKDFSVNDLGTALPSALPVGGVSRYLPIPRARARIGRIIVSEVHRTSVFATLSRAVRYSVALFSRCSEGASMRSAQEP